MDKPEEKSEGESCCGSSKESCCSGKSKCCYGKTACLLVVILISALVGYGIGKCKGMWGCKSAVMANCPITGAQAPTPVAK